MTSLKKYIDSYIILCLWFCLAIVDIRIIEALFSTYYASAFLSHIINNTLGFCFDIVYFTPIALIFFPLFLLCSRKNERITSLIFRLVATFSIYIGLLLVCFFAQAQFPLDRVLFLYSFAEIKETVINSSVAPWWMYVIVVGYPIAFFFISKIQFTIHKTFYICFAIVIALCLLVRIVFYNKSIENQGYPEQCNKVGYLTNSVIEGLSIEEFDLDEVHQDATKFHAYFPQREFLSQQCPFLHKTDTTDVLAPFFNLDSTTKPNIVIIFVEGLGRENSGKYSKYVSATPFLDSLAEHSLYWLNCLSVSQKTNGVMPGVFGALPFGREGFMAYKQNAPEFYSLPKFFKANGYDFSFYYGGWCAFDDMNHFIDLQNGKQCFEEKFDSLAPRNTWGLLDKFLFSEAIKDIDFESDKPRLDVFMTLTSHDPWEYPNTDSLMAVYKQKAIEQKKAMNPNTIATASYLYVDDALRQLFHDFSEKPGFENTIFILTGDHNYNASTYIIERYHVPLLIWSPMLKEAREFPAIVAHRDIPNSIISLISGKYKTKKRNEVAWINGSLDTANYFRSQTFAPQIDPARAIVSMVYNENFVYNNTCYKIDYKSHTLHLTKQKNKRETDSILQLYELYKKLDLYVCSFNALLDSSNIYASRKELIHKDTRQFVELFANSNRKDTTTISDEFINLVSFPLQKKQRIISPYFNCQFRYTNEVEASGLEFIVTVRNTEGKEIFHESYPILIQGTTWNTYLFDDVMLSLKDFIQDGNTLFVYIWNPSKREIEITDIHTSIFELQ